MAKKKKKKKDVNSSILQFFIQLLCKNHKPGTVFQLNVALIAKKKTKTKTNKQQTALVVVERKLYVKGGIQAIFCHMFLTTSPKVLKRINNSH